MQDVQTEGQFTHYPKLLLYLPVIQVTHKFSTLHFTQYGISVQE